MKSSITAIAFLALTGDLAGCASQGKPPPAISLDESVKAQPLPEPPKPVAVVEVPKPLPLPDQMKPLPGRADATRAPEPADAKARVEQANAEASVVPTRDGYINAIQVWPFSDGALYQVYTSPGRVTVISLQTGEELVTVAAGDTVQWIVGDTASGSGTSRRVAVMVKPVHAGIKTNLVITTSRRTYLLELTSTAKAWMASVSWEYPRDQMLALQAQAQTADAQAPAAEGLSLDQLHFRYAITGDSPPWKPVRAFDDGQHVYIQFPAGIAQGELPPLFAVGPDGQGELVNYRFHAPYDIVDRLFGAAELRLGGDKAAVVRIERTDGVAAGAGHGHD
ncbi:P-type conjugative transfer protein TrbG [Burkholderia multivorans]|uniref:P-type conjugative transfer protein TrbG n=1 Tax=Burkholderia multivorans TaxID=87883 RepID=UPI0020A1E492|nr:P-type conjugative transfer protein TrbG [Burkholderia multivorans]MCO8611168.1 P-type conjugative transfer protein TrbG [Burkholderia multivorans]MCO8638043.1 P-type conjugative transfer protein TrbG [Burkholderia multivorans]MCO8646195.1 P-type conjugative transfer protein TrbG [Burkholderia multivorans]